MSATAKITCTYDDGSVETYDLRGVDTERNLKRRRTFDRVGPGWAEKHHEIPAMAGYASLQYTERIEWLS